MNCQQCRPLLSHYHDAMLSAALREDVQAHLHACPQCTAHLASYRELEQHLQDAFRTASSPRFQRDVLAVTMDRTVRITRTYTRRRDNGPHSPLFFGGLVGGSVAGLIALLLLLANGLPKHTSSQPSLAASGPLLPTRHQQLGSRTPFTPDSPVKSSGGHVLAQIKPTTVAPRRVGWPSYASTTTTPPGNLVDHALDLRVQHETALVKDAIHGPLWSHDGRSLLYLTNWSVDPATGWYVGTLHLHTPSGDHTIATQVRDYVWASDDQSFAYTVQAANTSGLQGPQALHLTQVNGLGDRVVSTGVDRAPIYYLAGQLVVVHHGVLTSLDPRNGASRQLTQVPTLKIEDADSAFYALSANGQFLAYQDRTSLRIWDRHRHGQLLFHQALAPFGESSFHFSWDGKTLFYSTYDAHYTMLYRLALTPFGQPVALNDSLPLPGPILVVGPTSPDDSVVAFRTGQGASARCFVIDTRHGHAHLLLPPGGVGPIGWWAPTGDRMVYTVYRGADPILSAIATVVQ